MTLRHQLVFVHAQYFILQRLVCQLRVPNMAEPHEYTLIAAPHSYFSGKLRAYLRFKCIPFKELPASAEVMESVVKAKTGVRYIPVVITPSGVALQDTTVIIDYFESFVEPKHSIYPSTP